MKGLGDGHSRRGNSWSSVSGENSVCTLGQLERRGTIAKVQCTDGMVVVLRAVEFGACSLNMLGNRRSFKPGSDVS